MGGCELIYMICAIGMPRDARSDQAQPGKARQLSGSPVVVSKPHPGNGFAGGGDPMQNMEHRTTTASVIEMLPLSLASSASRQLLGVPLNR